MGEKKEFKTQSQEYVYKGKVMNVRIDTVKYDGREFSWEIIEQGNAVVIIPQIDRDTYILIHQYRYTIGEYIYEFPAGKVEENEHIEISAQRELAEECGYKAHTLEHLVSYYPSPGIHTERMHLYLATGLYPCNEHPMDEDEILSTKICSLSEIGDMVSQGTIIDGKTILAYFLLRNRKYT